jgi:hypothetical protein
MLRERAVVSAISWCVRGRALATPTAPRTPVCWLRASSEASRRPNFWDSRARLHRAPITITSLSYPLSPPSQLLLLCALASSYTPQCTFLACCSCSRRSLPSPPTRLDSEGAAIHFAVRTKSRARRVDSLLLANSSRYGSALSERERCGGAVRKQRPSVYTYATHSEAHTS